MGTHHLFIRMHTFESSYSFYSLMADLMRLMEGVMTMGMVGCDCRNVVSR